MKLYSLLQSFVNYANGQYHLEPLLRQGERTVNFRFGDESCSLQISRDYIELLTRGKRNGANRLFRGRGCTKIGDWKYDDCKC